MRKINLTREAFYPNKHNIGQRVINGVAWQFGLMGFRVIITIVSTAILAKILTPDDYGLVTMSMLTTEMAGLLANLGFGQIIVQKQRLSRLDLDSVFWLSALMGVGLFLITGLISYPVAWFYERPELIGILWVSGINFIFRELFVIPNAILHRLLLFKAESFIIISQLILRTIFAIYFAWLGYGYWSLVLGPLLAGFIEIVISSFYVGYVPRLKFNRAFIMRNWRMNGSYLGSGILNYIMSNLDYIIVGRRFGSEQLGYYQIAYALPDELRNRLSGPLQRVLFPAFSLLQDDLAAFRQGVARSQRLLSVIVLPIGAGLALTAENIVKILYGEQWLPVIPLLQILAINGALRTMFSLVGSIYYARGRPDLAFKITLCLFPFIVLCIYAGSLWGVQGVAWAMLLVMLPCFYTLVFAMRLIDASVWLFYQACLPAFNAVLFMSLSVWFASNSAIWINYININVAPEAMINLFLEYSRWYGGLAIAYQLTFQVIIGCMSYISFLNLLYHSTFMELVNISLKLRKKKHVIYH